MTDDLPWRDAPPVSPKLPHLPLIRIGAAATVSGAVTVDAHVGIDTHFFHRRTLPCVGAGCPGCAEGRPKRWEGYIAIYTTAPSRHVIIALTPGLAADLLAFAADKSTLRGRFVSITRQGKRPNGRLTITCEDRLIPPEKLPPPPLLRAHLAHIWGLDQAHAGQDQPGYAEKAAAIYREEITPPPAQ